MLSLNRHEINEFISSHFRIIANGASGARGRENSAISKGDEIRALVYKEIS